MRCIIVEDQPPAQRILKKFIQDVPALELVGVFSDGLQAMEFLKKLYPDVWERIWSERLQRMENIACIREPNPIPVFREPGERPWTSGPPQSP